MIKKHTFPSFPSLISFPPLGKYAYPGWYDPARNFIRCMWHVLYIDWFMYIYGISTTSLATHKSVWDYLFQCHARCRSCVTTSIIGQSHWGARSCLGSYICLQTFFALMYKGHMKTLSSRCVLVLMALFIIPPITKLRGGILDSPCSSVRPSVRGSVSGW